MNSDDFFLKICKGAMNELAKGEVSFKDAPTNTLLLACFGFLTNHLTHRLARPLWFFAGSVCAGVITFIIAKVLGS